MGLTALAVVTVATVSSVVDASKGRSSDEMAEGLPCTKRQAGLLSTWSGTSQEVCRPGQHMPRHCQALKVARSWQWHWAGRSGGHVVLSFTRSRAGLGQLPPLVGQRPAHQCVRAMVSQLQHFMAPLASRSMSLDQPFLSTPGMLLGAKTSWGSGTARRCPYHEHGPFCSGSTWP